jgi:hypothetical protein
MGDVSGGSFAERIGVRHGNSCRAGDSWYDQFIEASGKFVIITNIFAVWGRIRVRKTGYSQLETRVTGTDALSQVEVYCTSKGAIV